MGFQNDAQFLNYVPGVSPYMNPVTAMIAQGQRQEKQQKGALAAQEKAQKDAQSLAAAQLRQNAEALRKAQGNKPDVGALLAGAQEGGKKGLGATLLTGPSGVDPNNLKLGKPSMLGG